MLQDKDCGEDDILYEIGGHIIRRIENAFELVEHAMKYSEEISEHTVISFYVWLLLREQLLKRAGSWAAVALGIVWRDRIRVRTSKRSFCRSQ